MPTLFTRIVQGEIPCHKVAESDQFLAFLDIQPIAKGHVLVIPKREIDYIFDINDAEFTDLHLFAKSVALKMKKVIPCIKIGVAVVGLEVPHAHIHLVPMNSVGDLSFTGKRLDLSKEELAQIASEIANA